MLRLLPLLLVVPLLTGCERELRDLLHRSEVFLRAHPLVLYIVGAVVVVAIIVKLFRVAAVLAVVGLILLALWFLAGF